MMGRSWLIYALGHHLSVAVIIIAGLVPLFIGTGAGSEVTQRIAAPMIGGMVTAALLSMFVVPAVYLLINRRTFARHTGEAPA